MTFTPGLGTSFGLLLRKELRQLLPWAITLLTIEFATWVWLMLTAAPDRLVWAAHCPLFTQELSAYRGGMLWLWAVVLAYAGFPREQDDGTLVFLFGLPLSRARIVLGKFTAAALVLTSAVVLEEALNAVVTLPNRSSISGHTFRWDWALLSLGLSAFLALVTLAYAFLLSLLRGFGVLLGVMLITLLFHFEDKLPLLRALNPLNLLHVDFIGSSAVINGKPLLGHALAAVIAVSIAGYFWVGRLEHWAGRLTRWSKRPVTRVLFALSLIGALVASAFLFDDSAAEAEFGTLAEFDSPEAVLTTQRYRFRYPSALEARVERFAKQADALHDQLADALRLEPAKTRIQVNMLQTSHSHAGSATWNAIRLDLHHSLDESEFTRTLVHETAHVFALRLSDRRLPTYRASTRVFDEGLAQFLSFELVPHAPTRKAEWLKAVLALQRFDLRSSALFDAESLQKEFGEALLYPLGYSFVEALTESCGRDAPARVLRAMAKPNLSRELSGPLLWRTLLSDIGCGLDQVVSRWTRLYEQKQEQLQAEVDRVPQASVGISHREADSIVLRAKLTGERLENASHFLYTRAEEHAAYANYFVVNEVPLADDKLDFYVNDWLVSGKSLEFQFVTTWLYNGVTVSHPERWQRARIPE